MIIGYYPGGGGHRYYNFVNGLEFNKSNIAYDLIINLRSRGLHLDKDNQITTPFTVLLLHCVNYYRIHQETNKSDIVIIKSDLKDSLCREWTLKGKYKQMFFPEKVNDQDFLLELYYAIKDHTWPQITSFDEYKKLPKKIFNEVEQNFNKNKEIMSCQSVENFLVSAYTAIAWHHDLYKKYPLDPGPGVLVDIDTDSTEFGQVMRREFALYQDNKLFNFAWQIYENLGADAPIMTLFQESNLKFQ